MNQITKDLLKLKTHFGVSTNSALSIKINTPLNSINNWIKKGEISEKKKIELLFRHNLDENFFSPDYNVNSNSKTSSSYDDQIEKINVVLKKFNPETMHSAKKHIDNLINELYGDLISLKLIDIYKADYIKFFDDRREEDCYYDEDGNNIPGREMVKNVLAEMKNTHFDIQDLKDDFGLLFSSESFMAQIKTFLGTELHKDDVPKVAPKLVRFISALFEDFSDPDLIEFWCNNPQVIESAWNTRLLELSRHRHEAEQQELTLEIERMNQG